MFNANLARIVSIGLSLSLASIPLHAQPAASDPAAASLDTRLDEVSALSDTSVPIPPKPEIPPPSFGLALEPGDVPLLALDALDLAALAEQDAAVEGGPWRNGVVRELSIKPSDGLWRNAPDGGRIWMLDVLADAALGLRIHFAGMNLPDGASLYAYPVAAPARFIGPYQGRGLLPGGSFWSPTLFAGDVRIELYVPPNALPNTAPQPFRVDQVLHIYRTPEAPDQPPTEGPACRQDVTCDAAWVTASYAMARISFVSGGFSYICSGQLLNNQLGDFTPYFMTANHCINTDAEAQSVELFWRYQTDTCNAAPPPLSSVPTSNVCTLLSHGLSTDYSLLMVDGELPGGNLTWLGWDPNPIANGTPATGIHHPAGSYKRISHGAKSSQNATHHWIDWSSGGTEGGSSGSAIMLDSSQGFIGQLSGNVPDCWFQDNYGRFDLTYPNVSTLLAGGSDDALEDNDTCTTARTIFEGGYPNLVVKRFDEDWYRISLAAGEMLNAFVNFTDAFGDIDMELYDACGGSILASSTSSTDNESLSYVNTGGAVDVYLHVYLFNDFRNDYSMAISIDDHCFNCPQFDQTLFPSDTYATISDSFDAGACRWYRIWMTQNSRYRLTTCEGGGGTAGDTVFELFDDACIGLAFNDDTCGLGSQIDFTAPTTGYRYLNVTEFANDQSLSYTLAYQRIPGACTACPTFDYGPFTPSLTPTLHADTIFGGGCRAYRFNLTAGCEYTFTFCSDGGAADYDTFLTLRDASCNAVAGNDDACGLLSEIAYTPTTSGSYFLEVNSCCVGGSGGSYTLSYRQSSTQPNDECANAIPMLTGLPQAGSTRCATGTDITDCTFNDTIDVWYLWNAPCDIDVKISLCGSSYDTALAVFDGCGGAQLACNDDNFAACGPGNASQIDSFAAVGGVDYLIRVSGFNGATGDFVLNISPANDDCVDAIPVTDGVWDVCSIGATTDGPDEPLACVKFGDTQVGSDIWYAYTASCTGTLTVSLCGSSYDTKLAVYDGAFCPSISGTALACDDDFCLPSGRQSELTLPVTAGNRYLIRIGGFEGAQGAGVLTLRCSDCPGDIDHNGQVDLADLSVQLAHFGTPAGAVYEDGDLDGDGDVDLADLAVMLALFGTICN